MTRGAQPPPTKQRAGIFMRYIIAIILYFITTLPVQAASLPPVEGKSCMAVSAQHYATDVGVEILKKGGNAVDAAVAMGYALAVVYPCCGNIGGGGFMLIHLANGKNTFLNFREKAPSGLNPGLFLDAKGNVVSAKLSGGHRDGTLEQPYLAVGVPGTVLGLNTALKKYGSMDLATVMRPAIHLARQGFKLARGDVDPLNSNFAIFRAQPNIAEIFLKQNRMYQVGDTLIQKNLANTLQEIADHGSQGFYRGKIAQALVSASQAQAGVMTMQDLANYTVQELSPISCQYRGYTIVTSPPPSGGGVMICEVLNTLQHFPLETFGFHSAAATHVTVEAMKQAYLDRNTLLGDPDFVQNPVEHLLSKQYTEQMLQKISSDHAAPLGNIRFVDTPEGHNTTAYVVSDNAGNAVAVTYTLNDYFGAKVIAGKTGFFLNNEISDFTIKTGTANNYGLLQGEANLLKPGKRPLSSMAPTFIFKNNQLLYLMGTPGGSTIPTQLIAFIQNVIDYKMPISDAENAPRFHMQASPDSIFMEPFCFSKDTQQILEGMGHQFQLGSPYHTLLWGSITAIERDLNSHKVFGAVDARRPTGSAAGF